MTHQDLVDSLVNRFLSSPNMLVLAQIGIGSRYLQGSIPIPDVMTLRYCYNRPDITIYEVKASLSDFRQDVNKGKYRRYIPFCDRIYFAVPRGLINKTDTPQETGLITYNDDKKSWAVIKASPRYKAELGQIEWLSLMFAKAETGQEVRKLRTRINLRENAELSQKALRLGSDIRHKLEGIEAYESQRNALREHVARGLGLPVNSLAGKMGYSIETAVRKQIQNAMVPKDIQLAVKIIAGLSKVISRDFLLDKESLTVTMEQLIAEWRSQEGNDSINNTP